MKNYYKHINFVTKYYLCDPSHPIFSFFIKISQILPCWLKCWFKRFFFSNLWKWGPSLRHCWLQCYLPPPSIFWLKYQAVDLIEFDCCCLEFGPLATSQTDLCCDCCWRCTDCCGWWCCSRPPFYCCRSQRQVFGSDLRPGNGFCFSVVPITWSFPTLPRPQVAKPLFWPSSASVGACCWGNPKNWNS